MRAAEVSGSKVGRGLVAEPCAEDPGGLLRPAPVPRRDAGAAQPDFTDVAGLTGHAGLGIDNRQIEIVDGAATLPRGPVRLSLEVRSLEKGWQRRLDRLKTPGHQQRGFRETVTGKECRTPKAAPLEAFGKEIGRAS